MKDSSIILSVLIISYNQKNLLKRCVESVLQQKLFVPYEIVICDALSTDGTWEWISECEHITDGIVHGVSCDTEALGAVNRTECCGLMKLTAYNNATGKYFVNIDADDYLRSDDIYQHQINMLEEHPECSMCMQRIMSLKDGENFDEGVVWPSHPLLVDGAIIQKEDFLKYDLRGLNQGYMIRRQVNDDMMMLYGKWFDDTVITYHHLQYGPIVFVDRADYIWVQYKKSISHSITGDDNTLLYGTLPIHHAILIPTMSYQFLLYGLKDVIHMFKVLPLCPSLSSETKQYFKQFDAFIFRFILQDKHSLFDLIRYFLCRCYCLIIRMMDLKSHTLIKILCCFIIGKKR